MRASDVMTRSVVTVTQDATIVDAAKLMISHRISGVPVVEREGRLVGIVTEGDLLRRAETGTEGHRSAWSGWFSPNSRLAADYIKSHARRVADIMTRSALVSWPLSAKLPISWRRSGSNGFQSSLTKRSLASSAAPICFACW